MDTPIVDFVAAYAQSGAVRLHMPGHKGKPFLGCEAMDITEIAGADALYEAGGIIAQSEANAARIFATARTLYSTEGSTQCIKAMLYLALTCRSDKAPWLLAARNVHKALIYGAALLDLPVRWLWPAENVSPWACPVTAEGLEQALSAQKQPPIGVYITSPDYLGNMADIAALAKVCHRHDTLLLVDNAHGAYLRFLTPSVHPMDLGADLCCDSAHKTLPVLTGGAYLHISPAAPPALAHRAKQAMALFGSTSPSYLTLASLDLANRYLAEEYPAKLAAILPRLADLRQTLARRGWHLLEGEPLKLTLLAPPGLSGAALARRLQKRGVVCEYADQEHLVLMLSGETSPEDLSAAVSALGENSLPYWQKDAAALPRGEQVMSIRQAVMAPYEILPTAKALGRICAAPTVSCPPAVPLVISGERITPAAIELCLRYGIDHMAVVR